MDDLTRERVRQEARRKVGAVAAKLVGAAMLCIGLMFLGLLVWGTNKVLSLDRALSATDAAILGPCAIVGAFCLYVGWRLVWNRPNRYGSILGPMGWRVLGVLFGLAAVASVIFGAVLTINSAAFDVLVIAAVSVVGSSIFCFWCLQAAARAAALGKKGIG